MRYTQTREQSAELLRMVIQHLAQQAPGFDPVAYAIWYEHLAGINPRLSEALEARLAAGGALDAASVAALHREHVAEAGSLEAERVGREIQRVVREVIDASAQGGARARAYGEELTGLERALTDETDPAALATHIGQAVRQTRDMQQSVEVMSATLGSREREIERLRDEVARIRVETTTDPLTRVLNRKGFDEALARLLAAPPRSGLAHCLVLIDIDHFKQVNDRHGHLVGDDVLRALGHVLRQGADAQPGASCARFGGEEFALLLHETTLAQALTLTEALRTATKALRLTDRRSAEAIAPVTFSAGVAAWDGREDTASLIASADRALYRAKESGRDRTQVS